VAADLDAGRAVTRALTGFVTMEGIGGFRICFKGDPGRGVLQDDSFALEKAFNEAELDGLRTVAFELTLAVGRKAGGERDDWGDCLVGDAGRDAELKRGDTLTCP
jgi:hypothetical protein